MDPKNTSFPDDDLKLWRTQFNKHHGEKGLALLARLEAAERICLWAKGICPDRLEEAWRKSKGE